MRENAHQTSRHGRITGTLIAGIAAAGLLTGHAEGSILFWDSFEYGDDTALMRDNPGGSEWETTSGVLWYDAETNLTHPGLQAEAGGSFHHDHGSGNRSINQTISIDELAAAGPGDEFWLAGLIQLANHDGHSRVQFTASNQNVDDLGFGVDGTGNVQFFGSIDGGGNTWHDTGETAAADGSTYLFLVQAVRGSGTFSDRDSTVNFWFDPEDTSSEAALGAPDFTNSVSKFGRDGVWDAVNISLSYQSRADEIRFGTSLQSVVIPEPASLALLGLGGLLLVRRRREQERD